MPNIEQIPILFEEPKKEEEIKKVEEKKPEPLVQVIKLTDEQLKNRREDLDNLHEKHFN